MVWENSNCNKKGHYARACQSEAVREVHATGEEETEIAFLGSVSAEETEEAWRVKIKVNDHKSEFRIDTGADVTAIPESVHQEYGQFPELIKIRQSPLWSWKEAFTCLRKVHS